MWVDAEHRTHCRVAIWMNYAVDLFKDRRVLINKLNRCHWTRTPKEKPAAKQVRAV
jgi:hypothetical protein